ncbi:MAG: hypothetical protein U0166_26135 [Acidobacteriota bacterium]
MLGAALFLGSGAPGTTIAFGSEKVAPPPIPVAKAVDAVYKRLYRPEIDDGLVALAGEVRGTLRVPDKQRDVTGTFAWHRGETAMFDVRDKASGGTLLVSHALNFLLPRSELHGLSTTNPEWVSGRYVATAQRRAGRGGAVYHFDLEHASALDLEWGDSILACSFFLDPEGRIVAATRSLGGGFEIRDRIERWCERKDRDLPCQISFGQIDPENPMNSLDKSIYAIEYVDVDGVTLPGKVRIRDVRAGKPDELLSLELSYSKVERSAPPPATSTARTAR